jgi:hypothetical protein
VFKLLHTELSAEKIESIEAQVATAHEARDAKQIGRAVRPLRKRLRHQQDCALSLLKMIEQCQIPIELGLQLVTEIFAAHRDSLKILGKLGEATQGVRDIDQLNLAAPEEPIFQTLVERLVELAKSDLSSDDETTVLSGLSTATRMMARQHDDLARASYKRLVELDPNNSTNHYNYGLFLKTRGFFAEGIAENAVARSLVASPVESYEWNYGICATGANEGELALKVWKQMGNKLEMGRFGLPDGGYPECKVRLAERPLAERGKDNDDPGLEETIWIERLSPCHGVIRSVLYQDLGVNFGDVVLIDGAPITYQTYGEREVPVFPQLATLRRINYQFYEFTGTQDAPGSIEDASEELAMDAVIYSHTENVQIVCSSCWRDADMDHEHDRVEKNIVSGKIAAPPEMTPKQLLAELDRALEKKPACRVYSPELCTAAGEEDRALVEARRFAMTRSSQ